MGNVYHYNKYNKLYCSGTPGNVYFTRQQLKMLLRSSIFAYCHKEARQHSRVALRSPTKKTNNVSHIVKAGRTSRASAD